MIVVLVIQVVIVVCSSLERALLSDGDIDEAMKVVDRREGPLDYFYGYFVKKVFMRREEEALIDLIGPENHKDVRDIILGIRWMEWSTTNDEARYASTLLRKVSAKVSRRYLKNPHRFLSLGSFQALEKNSLSSRRIKNIVTMVYSGDEKSVGVFMSLLDSRRVYLGDFVDVLEYLAKNGHSRSFGYLGEVYYHGIGVKRSLDKAMYFYSKGKEFRDAIGSCGVGKILMSSEYKDYKNAKIALTSASRIGQSGEGEYLMYLLLRRKPNYGYNINSHIESSLMNGYLPAISRDGMNYHRNGEYINACIRFYPVVEYSEVVYDLRLLAERNFIGKRYKQCIMALLMCVELGSTISLRNAVYVLQKHSVFRNQEKILFDLYMKLLRKGENDVVNRIGDAYFYGLGVDQSYDSALAFYMSSAVKNEPEGLYSVGYMYEHGYGVEKSLGVAIGYISKISPSDEMYLLLFYTYIRLVLKPMVGIIVNRYSIAICIGGLLIRRIYTIKSTGDE